MNRGDLYSLSLLLTGKKAEDLREHEVYYDSCFRFPRMAKHSFQIEGFNGKMFTTPVKQVRVWENYKYHDDAGKKFVDFKTQVMLG